MQSAPTKTPDAAVLCCHFFLGMVFCLDTKGPISRAMVVRFGRGITQSAVISLSLQAHPNCGCILMVAKSAAEVRNGLHSPDISASPSSATDCFPPRGIAVGTAISGRHTEGDSRMNRTSLGSAVGEADTLPPRSTVSGRHGCSEVPSASAESMTRRRSENAVHPSSDNSQARTSALQQESGDEATGDSSKNSLSPLLALLVEFIGVTLNRQADLIFTIWQKQHNAVVHCSVWWACLQPKMEGRVKEHPGQARIIPL